MRIVLCAFTFILLMASKTYGEIYTSRNAGMAGTGAASSHFNEAAQANPALLAQPYHKRRGYIGVSPLSGEASDKDEVVDTIDELDELFDTFESAVDTFTASPTTENQTTAENARDDILDKLESIDQKPIAGQLSIMLSVAVPYDSFSFAFDSRYTAIGVAQLNFDSDDREILQRAIDDSDSNLTDLVETTVNATGVFIKENIFSVAKRFDYKGREFSVGLSPKFVELDTYFYSQGAEDVDTDNLEKNDYRKDETSLNLDIGLAYYLSDEVTAGLVLKNIFQRDFKTITINEQFDIYETKLSATAGLALEKSFYSAAIDIDILPERGIKSVKNSQFIRLGTELNAFDMAQLRLGMRVDARGHRDNVVTAGVNFFFFNRVHFGLSSWSGNVWNGDSNTEGLALDVKVLF